MNKDEIQIDGIAYVRKSSITQKQPAKPKGSNSYCIVRTYSAGVFAGYFDRKIKGQEGTVYNARRLWYWDGANSLSELANEGVAKPQNCKFPTELLEVDLRNIIEVIPCTEKARLSIASVKIWAQ